MRVEWSVLQPTGLVPEARWGASATLMNGQLYLFGGATDEETLSDLWTLRLGNVTGLQKLDKVFAVSRL